jgi:SNF2 family DNA or RNA helicase
MGRVVMYMLEAATNPKLLVEGSMEGADPDVFRHPPLQIPAGSDLAEALARYNHYETPEKFTRLAALIKANADDGRKTLVWSNFVRNLELLKKMLARYQPALVHGGIDPIAQPGKPSREREIQRFRNDANCLVLLANPAATSEGISLHMECHDAIYLERTFNAGQYLQSVDRIHRLGLLPGTKTQVTFLITDATIDVAVDRRVREKAKRLGEMLDDPNLASVALPNDEDYGPPVEDELDVEELFRHLRGEH